MKSMLSKVLMILNVGIFLFFGMIYSTNVVQAATSTNWSWPTSIHSIQYDWPNYSGGSYHGGTDFPVALNSPVYATCDGEVVDIQSLTTSYGKHIKIRATVNGNTVYMRYCHLNSFKVSKGDKVKSGQVIGYSGATGRATGPHLHYEVRNANDYYGSAGSPNLNPRDYLPGTNFSYKTYDSFGNPVDLGTNFYAYIINTNAWKHLTNDRPNVSMRSETGAANQIWKFERQSDGSYKIINSQDNQVLDDHNFGQTDGTNVAVCESNNSDAQRWFVYGSSGAYYLRAKCGNLVLDVNGGSKSDGTNVQMWTKNDSAAQKFQIWKLEQPGKTNVRYTVGTGYTNTTFTWDKASNASKYDLKIWKGKLWQGDAYKILWDLSGTSAQVCLPPGYYEAYVDSRNGSLINMSNNVVKFTVSNGSPVNLGDDFYAKIITNKNQLALTNTSGNVDVRKQDNSTKQVWHFKRQSDGTYTIQNTADSKYLDTDNSRDANGTNIKTWTYNGSDAQKYYVFGNKSGEYILKPKCATRFVDVNGGKNNPGDNVQLWDFNGQDAQRMAIVKTSNPVKTECTHKFGSWSVVKKPTCTADGSEQRKCSLCGKTESRAVKATGHKYTDKVIAPTTTQKGYTLHTCVNCGYSYKDNYTNVKKQLVSISVASLPNVKSYYQNDRLDTTGMKITAKYSDGSQGTVTGWKVSGDTSKTGKIPITISYSEGGKMVTTTFSIQVSEQPKKTVVITYNPQGGTMSQTKQTVQRAQAVTLLNEKPKKSVWISFDSNGGNSTPDKVELQREFIDWSDIAGPVTKHYKSGASFSTDIDCCLYANYAPAKLSSLPKVKREGYVFEGWYIPDITKVTTDTIFIEDCTLVAKWVEIPKVHPHTTVEWVTVFEPTETKTGLEVLRCVECGQVTKTRIIPMLTDTGDGGDDPKGAEGIGDEITTDNEIYTITQLGDNPTVEYTQLFDEDMTEVVIPESVTIDGVTYKVTSVAPKAFYKNTSVKQVTIAGAVTEIGSKSFYGCTSLKRVVILSTKMQSDAIGENAFKKVAKNIKAYVPAAKYKAYKKMLKKAGIGSKAKIYKF